MTSTSEEPALLSDVLDALRQLSPQQQAEIWPVLIEELKLLRYAPSMVLKLSDEPPTHQPHGLFRSHLDLPLLTPEQADRMKPVFTAVWELVRQHQRCTCDPTVMAWRSAYAAALALLAPTPPDGPFAEPCFGDMPDGVWWGWRCTLTHGDHTAGIVRQSRGWSGRDARKAYSEHMKAKHPAEVRP